MGSLFDMPEKSLVAKYRYSLKRSNGFVLVTLLLGLLIFFLFHFFKSGNHDLLYVVLFVGICTGFVLFQMYYIRYILITPDKIIIQKIFGADVHISNDSIVSANGFEDKGNLSLIVKTRDGKSVILSYAFLDEIEFFEIKEYIEKLIAIRNSLPLPKSKVTQLSEKKEKDKWQLGMLSLSLLALLSVFLIVGIEVKGLIDIVPFVVVAAMLSVAITWFIWKKMLHNVDHIISKATQWSFFIMNLIIPTIVMTYALVIVNIKFDDSQGIPIQTKLANEYIPKKQPQHRCYQLINPATSQKVSNGLGDFCTQDFPWIKENSKVNGWLKPGFFGGEWIHITELDYKKIDPFK